MNMTKLPNNSSIIIANGNGGEVINIPHKEAGKFVYFIGFFISLWLIAWIVGFISALIGILEGAGGLFLIVWLAMWTLGGIFAFYLLYRILKKPISEKLILKETELIIDSGIPPFYFSYGYMNLFNMQEYWNNLFPKREINTFNIDEIKTLKLRESSIENRLTIDKDSKRLDIAKGASEIEREWLFEHVKTFYLLEDS